MDDLDDPSSGSQDLETMRLLFGGRVSNGTASINVNAGGIGVWIATTACLVALTCCGFMAIISVDQGRKIDRLEDYISSIFRVAPALQEQLEAEQSKKEK